MTGWDFVVLALCNYSLYYLYRNIGFLKKLREFIYKKISPKLVECAFCLGFWLSPISILMTIGTPATLYGIGTFLVLMLYSATANYLISAFLE